MADNLIFPIGFDLEKAVNEAGQQWDKKYAKKLEDYMAKRPVRVKLDFEKLEDVKKRLAQLRIEPITPETKSAIKELAKELQQLAKALELVQKYSVARGAASSDSVRASRIALNEQRAKAQAALAAQRAAKAEDNLAAARLKAARAANVGSTATRSANKALQEQAGYLQRLTQRMVAYWSIQQVGSFLTNVREVTAQFELQRVSLGAIIQDQGRANQLFGEIKNFALKSPVKILDLTKYTKQLAAYKVGWDGIKTDTKELFDWTKKLTDVSVGLGVSMDRVVLAFGQVRATGYLRASEIRQFTEMGVPIVEELASKLSTMNGELVTAAQVMDMVSKRGVSFELVKEVFDDMTSAGGIFYNMQEKQGNTLYGMWQKLGDAAAVMYDEIGNTSWVNEGMKDAIQLLRTLMLNWKQTAVVVGGLTATLALNTLAQANARVAMNASSAANIKNITTLNARQIALQRELALLKGVAISERTQIAGLISATQAEISAATATNVFSRSLHKLKAALMSNPIGLLAVALSTVIGYLMTAESEVGKLMAQVGKISSEYASKAEASKKRFEELVDVVKSSADGSRRQKEALDELNRTYGEILGREALEIKNLRAMTDGYEELTDKIDQYHRRRRNEEVLTATKSSWAKRIEDAKGPLRSYLQALGATGTEIEKVFMEIRERIEMQGEDAVKVTKDVVGRFEKEFEKNNNRQLKAGPGTTWDAFWGKIKSVWNYGEDTGFAYRYGEAIQNMGRSLDGLEKRIAANTTGLGEYAEVIDMATRAMANLDFTSKEAFDESMSIYNKLHPDRKLTDDWMSGWLSSNDPGKAEQQLEKDMLQVNARIMDVWHRLTGILEKEGVGDYGRFFVRSTNTKERSVIRWNEIFGTEGLSDNAKNVARALQSMYEGFAPSDRTADTMTTRLKQIADASGIELKRMTSYYMKAGESLEDYKKRLEDSVEGLDKSVTDMRTVNTQRATGEMLAHNGYTEEEIKRVQEMADALRALLGVLPEAGGGRGGRGRGDGRVETLEKINRALREMYKQYGELEKRLGSSKASEQIDKTYRQELEYLNSLAHDIGFDLNLDAPKTIQQLNRYQTQIYNSLNKIKTNVARRAMIDLGKVMDSDWIDDMTAGIDAKLKALADRISRTKTAKEFYEKILSQTGDVELAARVSLSIYGSTGEELFEDTVAQIREVFKSGKEDVVIDLKPVFDMTNQRIDYKMLADIYEKYQNDIIDKNRDTAKKIAQEGQKTTASNIANWQKELAKAKDFEQQRMDIIRTAAAEREKIIKEVRDPEERERLLNLSREKESQDLSKLNFEEFTKSEDYIKIFENLDNTATSTLKRLRTELQALIDTNKDLSPENMKTLVKAMEDIDEQISGRGFGNDMVQSVNDYITSIKNLKTAKQELAKAEAEYESQEPRLDADIETAKAEKESADADVVAAQQALFDIQTQMAALRQQEIVDETQLAALQAQEVAASNALTAAELKQNQAKTAVVKAEQAKAKAADKVKKAEQKVTGEQDKQKKATTKFFKDLQQVAATADQLANELSEVKNLLGISEDSAAGLVFDSAISSLQQMSAAINIAASAQAIFNAIAESNPYIAIAAGVLAVGSAIASWISGSKVRKANKEIERQQELLEQLEYTYGRLEKAAEKAFGADYVANQNQQRKILLAQQQAYMKQYEAEMSKGKKADEEKAKEFLNKARDIGDQIADMEGKIAEQMAGTDVASAARDFANAWLEAYASFGNTTEAIKEKFNDMIKHMIVESIMARTVQMALEPMFKEMDDMYKSGASMTDVLTYAFGQAGALTEQITDGLAVNAKQLEAMGINIRDLYASSDNMSGISKDIAGATSEEINALAAFTNTALYYVSPIPTISENVAAMRMLMERGTTTTIPEATAVGWTDWQQQAMAAYNATAKNTADMVVLCERAAVACEAMAEAMGRAFRAKGTTSGFNVFLNS